jgi:hypothetical protein
MTTPKKTATATAGANAGWAGPTTKQGWWAAAIFAVATLALAYPALAGQFLVSVTSDQYKGGFAVRTFETSYLLATGHFPQWNPYLFGGMPFVASMNGDLFYPTMLLRLILPPDVAVTWAFVIHQFLAGFFTYRFLRAWGLGFFGALIGGLAYMMGGPIASYVSPGHDGKLYVSALFPLMAWAVVRGIRDGRAWAWPALALTTGLSILSPHVQITQYNLIGIGIIGLYLAFGAEETSEIERPEMYRRLALMVGACGLGLVMGAIQFAPVLPYAKWSPRGGGVHIAGGGWDFTTSFSMPIEELFNCYLPQFTGILDSYWGRNGIHHHSEYLGASVLAIAGAAFFSRRRRSVWLWVGLGVLATLWSLGGNTPFFHIIYALVPGTKFFRAPAAFFYLAGFALAALAGEGVEAILERRVSMVYVGVVGAVAALIAVLAVSGELTGIAASIAAPQEYERVLDNSAALAFGAFRSFVAVALTLVVVVLVARGRMAATAAAWAMAALVVVDLWSIERLYWKFSPPASTIFAADATVSYLQHISQPGRVITFPAGPTVVPGDAELQEDALMIHRVRQVKGYHGNEIYRYDQLLDPNGDNRFAGMYNPHVWQLLNAQYFLTGLDSIPGLPMQRVMGPVIDASGSTLYLYKLPGVNPVAWVAPLAVKAPDAQTFATVLDERFNPLQAVIFDTSAKVEAVARADSLPAPVPITVTATRYDPGHLTFELSQPAPRQLWFVASENFYPGWRATVDGKPTPVGRADYTLIGLALPAGAKTVDLQFADPNFAIGAWITLLTVGAGLVWLFAALRVARPPRG